MINTKELIEVNLVEVGKEAQPFFISASLSTDLRKALLDLLNGYKDDFRAEMPRVDP